MKMPSLQSVFDAPVGQGSKSLKSECADRSLKLREPTASRVNSVTEPTSYWAAARWPASRMVRPGWCSVRSSGLTPTRRH